MRNFIAALLLLGCALAAAARQSVPVVDYIDIPTKLATDKPTDAETIRRAFERAAPSVRWLIRRDADGLIATYARSDGEYGAVAKITVSDTAYSVRYHSSLNLNYKPITHQPHPMYDRPGIVDSFAAAAKAQQERYSKHPEFPFRVPRSEGQIHPTYESLVHELLTAVRLQLKHQGLTTPEADGGSQ